MSADPAWVALSLVEHLGGKKLRALMAHFNGDIHAILRADQAALRRVPGIGVKIAAGIHRIDLAQVERALGHWEANGVHIITLHDPAYPPILRAIDDAPPTLFVCGTGRPIPKAIAIVGTRRPSAESIDAAQGFSYELACRGAVIVSGLALGIDTAAHLGALSSPDGFTLAVLGGGVLNVYPPENRALANAIAMRGALLCEVHPAAEAKTPALVARNRLISGLCDAVIVVETSGEGGAIHAAKRAFEQARRVYALDNDASGNRMLIDEMGAVAIGMRLTDIEQI
jgi:DNA processing protein